MKVYLVMAKDTKGKEVWLRIEEVNDVAAMVAIKIECEMKKLNAFWVCRTSGIDRDLTSLL